jgi:hypothetical protein
MTRKAKGSSSWFLGAITDENARTIPVSFSFLEPNKKYTAIIYGDADNAHWKDNPMAYAIEKITVDNNTTLNLKLAPGGGTAISIIPVSKRK